MAKRKYSKVKSVARRVYHKARRGVKRSYSAVKSGFGLMEIGFSFGYGYARSYLVNNSLVQKGIAMIPAGDYSDNVFLGLSAYLINWLLKPTNQYIKLGLRTIVNNESFLAGAKMKMGASISTPALTSPTVSGDYL